MSLKNNPADGATMLVRDFQELATEGERRRYGRIRAFEEAWQYYLGLNGVERSVIRSYESTNGEYDFKKFLIDAGKLYPALGIGDRVGIDMLLDSIGEEAERLGREEEAEILRLVGLRARTDREKKAFKSSYFRRIGER